MATTESAVLDRMRDVMVGLGYTEAVWDDFSKTPTGAATQAFAVTFGETTPIGQIGYFEEVHAQVEMRWQRQTNGDMREARGQMLDDYRELIAAIVRDGTAGNYAVADEARSLGIEFPPGASVARGTARFLVNFEAAL